jgi:hypothetical protein
MVSHHAAWSTDDLRDRAWRDGTQACRRGEIPVRIVQNEKTSRFDFRCDTPRETASWSRIDERVIKRLVGELIRRNDDRIPMHLLFVIFTLEVVRNQPVIHVVEPFGTQRSSDAPVVRRVCLKAREVPGALREKARGVAAAPFDPDHVTRQTTIELAHRLGRERGFFRMQRRADRRLKPVAEILRRPVIETAILQREDNAGTKVHQRLSVRGSRVGGQTRVLTLHAHRLESAR